MKLEVADYKPVLLCVCMVSIWCELFCNKFFSVYLKKKNYI